MEVTHIYGEKTVLLKNENNTLLQWYEFMTYNG